MDMLALLDELRVIARNGLAFAADPYDHARYARILELVEQHYGAALALPAAEVRARFAAEVGRVTPKVGTNIAIFDQQGAILLMQRPDSGEWCLPGGVAEIYETPAETAIREALEETGLEVRIVQFVDFFTRPARHNTGPHSLISIVYWCEPIGGTLRGSSEGENVRYWPIADVPTWEADHRLQAEAAHACWESMRHET